MILRSERKHVKDSQLIQICIAPSMCLLTAPVVEAALRLRQAQMSTDMNTIYGKGIMDRFAHWRLTLLSSRGAMAGLLLSICELHSWDLPRSQGVSAETITTTVTRNLHKLVIYSK